MCVLGLGLGWQNCFCRWIKCIWNLRVLTTTYCYPYFFHLLPSNEVQLPPGFRSTDRIFSSFPKSWLRFGDSCCNIDSLVFHGSFPNRISVAHIHPSFSSLRVVLLISDYRLYICSVGNEMSKLQRALLFSSRPIVCHLHTNRLAA